jgi:hypothetical protein
MSSFKIYFGTGVTLTTEEEDGKVSSIKWEGSQADQIIPGIAVELGMKISGVAPALEAFGWEFEEDSSSSSSSSSSDSKKKKKSIFSKDEESSE